MPTITKTIRGNKKHTVTEIRNLPKKITGQVSDRSGVGRAFRAHLFPAIFERIRRAFIAKSKWGQDEFGQAWKPLKPATIKARQRQAAKGIVGTNKLDRTRISGALSKANQEVFNAKFKKQFKALAAKVGVAQARRRAGQMAWTAVRNAPQSNPLEVMNMRSIPTGTVPMLRVTDRLLESVSPGMVADEAYHPPKEQIATFAPGKAELVLGSKVPYAKFVHAKRKLWPSKANLGKWLGPILAAILPKVLARKDVG